MDKYIIRITGQSLCFGWNKIEGTNVSSPSKVISRKELIQDLNLNGLEIFRSIYSSFGDCYFIEVSGKYMGKISIFKLDSNPDEFDWEFM